MANEKGVTHWKVSVGYGLLQAFVGLSVIAIKPLGMLPVMVLLLAWFSAFFAFGSFVRSTIIQSE